MVSGLYTHVLRLFLFRQIGKGGLGLHKTTHEHRSVRLYDGGEQGLLAGEVAVKGPGSDTGIFHDLPQGGAQKALLQELCQSGLLDLFQGGGGIFLHVLPPPSITSLYNDAILLFDLELVNTNVNGQGLRPVSENLKRRLTHLSESCIISSS